MAWGDTVDSPVVDSPTPAVSGASGVGAASHRQLPPREEYAADEPGVKIVIEYAWKDAVTQTEIVKTTKRVRTIVRTQVSCAQPVDVSKLSKFGDAIGVALKETTSKAQDPVHIENPAEEKNDMPAPAASAGQTNYWKKAQEKYTTTGGTGMAVAVTAQAGKYSAAVLAAQASAAAAEDDKPVIDPCCLRISGLHQATADEDLEQLMESAKLNVRRVKVIKSKRTGHAIFAFANFSSPMEAQKAKELLDGFGFNHMLLHVDFAEQRKQNIGAQSAMTFVSGYGKALPQNLS
jgi:translation initiation factor 3 subunit G